MRHVRRRHGACTHRHADLWRAGTKNRRGPIDAEARRRSELEPPHHGGGRSDGGRMPSADAGLFQRKTKKEKRIMSRLLVTAMFVVTSFASAFAQAPDAVRIRASFLKMIERPRVPLAPVTQPRTDADRYRAEAFSYATQAGERVPGVFFKSA